jgi:hypothetical protein
LRRLSDDQERAEGRRGARANLIRFLLRKKRRPKDIAAKLRQANEALRSACASFAPAGADGGRGEAVRQPDTCQQTTPHEVFRATPFPIFDMAQAVPGGANILA